MSGKTLRTIRIVVALLCLAGITAGIFLPGQAAAAVGSVLRQVQLIPALCAGAAFWLIFWTVTTLVAGRIYCSTVCPLGTLQDILLRLHNIGSRNRLTYRFTTGSLTVRFIVLLVLIESMALGVTVLTRYLDPYSDFVTLLKIFGAFSFSGLAVAVLILTVLLIFTARRRGRLLCNSICPVGALLGATTTMSLMRFDINPDLCTHCRKCEDACKGTCINSDLSLVDNTRCVVCFDCIAACPDKAISWKADRHRLQWPLLQSTATRTATIVPPIDTKKK